jgi:sec-independent protein translocase protein TatA
MLENPEKLVIIFVIALIIFGPSRLASIGGTIGRTVRDFRNAVRGAQDEFRFTDDTPAAPLDPPALPAPIADPLDTSPAAWSTHATDGSGMPASTGANPSAFAADDAASLASEPTAERLREALQSPR